MTADTNPLISVIVPTYNEEEFLPTLLLSLKAQTWKDFEIIVADDGSSDRTSAIAKSFSAELLVNKRIGEFPSRNAAALIARGSILVFTGADVILPKNILSEVKSKFARDPKLVGLWCTPIPYDAPLWARLEFTVWSTFNLAWYFITKEAHASTAFFAIRRDAFALTEGFADEVHADSTMSRQLSKRFRVRPILRSSILVSARRTKSGLVEFNRHHLVMVADHFFWFLRNSNWMRQEKTNRMGIHSRSGAKPEDPSST
jgi:glycosyltransferase involved in cell wall biosynthesis